VDRPPDLENPGTASADQTTADDARRRLRQQGIVAIEPDARIGVMLGPGERVVAIRRAVSLERRKDTRDPEEGLFGDLYVTTSRLVHLGSVPVEVPLLDIREAVAAAGALRLVVGDGRGVEIRTSDPRVLRVEIAAVREAARTIASRSRDVRDSGGDAGPTETGGGAGRSDASER
jgi:hypothetical protein